MFAARAAETVTVSAAASAMLIEVSLIVCDPPRC
jgi:hypothetical protein